jgi:transporter family-2 protein
VQILPYMLTAIAAGALVAMQPPLNAILSRAVGGPLAATVISIFVALVFMAALFAASGRRAPSPAALTAVPWWVYLGGVVGGLFVASGVFVAPVTGALLFFVCIVAGQLLGALAMDHFGAFGLAAREATPARLAGVGLVIAGATLVLRG